jgi:hypothetical protein
MAEYFEPVAVESIQPVLRAEPKKPLPILHRRRRPGLRQPVCTMDLSESDIRAIDQLKRGRLDIDPCLRDITICACTLACGLTLRRQHRA